MKEFDPEELKQFNGKDSQPVYVAHGGKVYDLTGSKLWKDGLHMRRHHAGGDLTTDIKAAPHGEEMLDRFPQVGLLKKKEITEIKVPKILSSLLARFPFLRRHPHPMTVHFPIVFMMAVPIFTLLYLILGIRSFETTALHCLAAGVLFTPIAITTGLYTWWLNYLLKPVRAIQIKKRLSFTALAVQILLFVWRLADPTVLNPIGMGGVIYLILTISLLPMVITIGWFGASLTFPIEEE
jgi:predicted heme/steroid binding protein/uncharacterized membrane protein